MFSIIISEKGGAERKETFDKNEINVGRVQGNDLMLPKGNVSKHHARLLFRDGRFIVTDLKSTNGTYVNGRKIAQATIVREGDKIYIGDFVLRVDNGGAASVGSIEPAAPSVPSEDESIRTLARQSNNSAIPGPAIAAKPNQPATNPPTMTMTGAPQARPSGSSGLIPAAAASAPYALDRDPDDSEEMRAARQSGPPAGAYRPSAAPAPIATQAPAERQSSPPQQRPSMSGLTGRAPAPSGNGPAAAPVNAARLAPRETAAQAGRRLALITLVDRIADAVDLRQLKVTPVVDDALAQQIERAAREQAGAMRDEGEAPEGIDIETLVRDAVRELVGLGPVGTLLDDEEVLEIDCLRHDQVLAVRESGVTLADASFTSEEALYRVIARLAAQSGDPWHEGELVIERRLPRGGTMLALSPPAASAHALVVRKRRRVDMTLDELVRGGAMSRPMATLLEAALGVRSNVLIVGASRSLNIMVAAALAAGGPPGERVATVHEAEEVNVAQAHAVALPLADTKERGAESIRAAARLGCDRLVIGSLSGHLASATIGAIADGAEGVIAIASASSTRQGLSHIAAQLVLSHAGMTFSAGQDVLAESFELVLEVAATPEGRLRIGRISEIAGSEGKGAPRDLFIAADGGFEATGVTPRIAADLASRGFKMDMTIFRRGAR